MDVNVILDRLEAQGAPSGIVREVRALLSDEAGIDIERYQRDRAAELKASRRGKAVDAIVTEMRRLDEEATARAAEKLDEHAQAEHVRVTSGNGHSVDLARIASAASAAEVVVLLHDAAAADADTLRRTWLFAEPRLRAMAATEARLHRLPGATSAFNALVTWQARMGSLASRAPGRAQLSEAPARQRQEIEQQVLAVARVVGLDGAVKQAMRRSAVPAPEQTSTVSVGRFFDQFKR